MPKLLNQKQLNMIRDGVFFPNGEISKLEQSLLNEFEIRLQNSGYVYFSIPSLISKDTYERQGTIPWEKVFKINETHALAGSAEQGILEHFKGKEARCQRLYARNQCFRSEKEYEGWKHLREFQKIEQFVFCEGWYAKFYFEDLLNMSTRFLKNHGIQYRVVDVTQRDPGYHVKKVDIEVWTETYGWMETHSCTYFGEEQTKRFNITGATHTVSNTGIASPRILIPFIERMNDTNE